MFVNYFIYKFFMCITLVSPLIRKINKFYTVFIKQMVYRKLFCNFVIRFLI